MAQIQPLRLAKAFESECVRSTSFLSHSVDTGQKVFDRLALTNYESPKTGWNRAVRDLHHLSSIQKIPQISDSLYKAVSKKKGALVIISKTADLGAKYCSLISVAKSYSALLPGAKNVNEKPLATVKITLHLIKSIFRISIDLRNIRKEKSDDKRVTFTLMAVNHSIRAISQGYRLVVICIGTKKSSNAVLLFRSICIGLELTIAYRRYENVR